MFTRQDACDNRELHWMTYLVISCLVSLCSNLIYLRGHLAKIYNYLQVEIFNTIRCTISIAQMRLCTGKETNKLKWARSYWVLIVKVVSDFHSCGCTRFQTRQAHKIPQIKYESINNLTKFCWSAFMMKARTCNCLFCS